MQQLYLIRAYIHTYKHTYIFLTQIYTVIQFDIMKQEDLNNNSIPLKPYIKEKVFCMVASSCIVAVL